MEKLGDGSQKGVGTWERDCRGFVLDRPQLRIVNLEKDVRVMMIVIERV